MLKIFEQKPKNNLAFMLSHLEAQFGERALSGRPGELKRLQAEAQDLQDQMKKKQQMDQKSEGSARSLGSHEDTDQDDDDDYVDDLPQAKPAAQRGPRASVSAEAFGTWNTKKAFEPPKYPKTPEQEKTIREKLNKSFMFQSLSEGEKDIVIAAMQERITEPKEVVIQEGDEGDCLYVVAQGTLQCQKLFKGNSEPTLLMTYEPEMAFGELALLYNAPRAATIIANEECLLWKLDRDTFNHIVKEAANKKREHYEAFLNKVPILSTMEPYERNSLADALKEH